MNYQRIKNKIKQLQDEFCPEPLSEATSKQLIVRAVLEEVLEIVEEEENNSSTPGDEKKNTIEELVPRNLLTEDQIKEMNGFEYKTNAIKYINSVSNVGLKVSATYYELYNDKNLEDDDNRRES